MTDEEKKRKKDKQAQSANDKRYTKVERPHEIANNRQQVMENYRHNQNEFARLRSEKNIFANDISNMKSTGAFSGDDGAESMYARGESLGLGRDKIDAFISKQGSMGEADGTGEPQMRDALWRGERKADRAPYTEADDGRIPMGSAWGPNGQARATGESNGPGGARGLTTGNERNELFSQSDRDNAKSMRKQSRAYNLAYRQKIRQGDREAALDILNDANDRGVSFGGVRSAGFFEQQAQRDRMAGYNTRGTKLPGRGGLRNKKDFDDDDEKDNKF